LANRLQLADSDRIVAIVVGELGAVARQYRYQSRKDKHVTTNEDLHAQTIFPQIDWPLAFGMGETRMPEDILYELSE
jgi:hypothetical protein